MSIKPDPQFQQDVKKAVDVGTTPFTNGGKTVVLFPVGPASNQLQLPDIENAIGSAGSRERANGIDPTVCGMLWHGRQATMAERPHAKFDRLDQLGMNTALLLDDVAKACASGSGGGGGVIVPVSALTRDGLRFRDAAGNDWRAHGITAFSIVADIRDGEKNRADEYLHWAQSYGVNIARFFNMWGNYSLSPKQIGYFDWLRQALEMVNARGMWAWPVRYCDQVSGSSILLTAAERAHYDAMLGTTYAGIAMLDEFLNEPWQNGDFAGELSRLFAPASRGSANDSQLPSAPGSLLDWTTHHTPRGDQQTRKFKELIDVAKLGFTGWPPSRMPALAGEPPRIAQDDWTDPQRVADYYAGCDLYGAGAVIHGGWAPDGDNSDLQRCRIPTDPTVLACMDAIKTVWQDGVPAGTFADGVYLRGQADNTGDLGIDHFDRYTDSGQNPAGALRTFAMQVGARQVIVPVDRGPAWQLGPRNGYRVVEQCGYNGNVIIVER